LLKKTGGAAFNKVRRAASENLSNTLRILLHNKAYGIMIYRFSSKIVPLATHPLLSGWDYTSELSPQLKAIGCFTNKDKIRVSFHPDHFTVLNSPKEEILQSSLKDFQHHCLLLKEMGLDKGTKLVAHVGGTYNDREKSIKKNYRAI
jgi:UV DNA damage endonuclease